MSQWRPVWDNFFTDADTNKDGKLTWEELRNVFHRYGFDGDDDAIKMIFDDMDINKDGLVTRQEFDNAMAQRPDEFHMQTHFRRVFMQADTDNDKHLTYEQIRYCLGECGIEIDPATLDDMLKDGDRKKTGKVPIDGFINSLMSQL